jgi:dienelactone hydrolase
MACVIVGYFSKKLRAMSCFYKSAGVTFCFNFFCCILLMAAGVSQAQERRVERIPTPWTEDGQAVMLELVVFRPPGRGPFPTAIFHHGSTDNGNNAAEVRTTVTYPSVAALLNARGWLVVFPQRRGRGQSGGTYAEGWLAHAGRYACEPAASLAAQAHALADLDVILAQVRAWPEVAAVPMLTGGHSRGGVLALVHAARHPGQYRAAMNFAGGWNGRRCEHAAQINHESFTRAGAFSGATVWVYGEHDRFYDRDHVQANFRAFEAAGGRGELQWFNLGGLKDGHPVVRHPQVWRAAVTAWLDGLPAL